MEGYPKLAALMSQAPGMAIFRQFAEVNILNLLSLQAEVTVLEDEVKELSKADQAAPDLKRKLYHISFEQMRELSVEGDDLQWNKLMQLREKITEYNNALLQVAALNKLPAAEEYDVNFLVDWLDRPDQGKRFLRGLESQTWGGKNQRDLVAVSARGIHNDPFTSWITDRLFPFLHRHGLAGKSNSTERIELGVAGKQDRSFNRAAALVATVLSSLLPTICIIILFFVRPLLIRLILILVFTVVFVVLLTLVTDTRRVESFAACAAFAAVQVVFVGSPEAKK